MSQNDDIDGPTGLEVVENVQTLDSTSSKEVKAFVASMREIVAGITELPVHHLLSFATPVSSVIFKRSVLLPFFLLELCRNDLFQLPPQFLNNPSELEPADKCAALACKIT